MAIQTTVNSSTGFGVIGEYYVASPHRAQSYILNSASAAYNVFGRGFSKGAQGIALAGNSGGTAVFAGILINPKEHPLLGTPPAPSLVLPNNVNAAITTMGSVWVTLAAAAALGDLVVYDNTTGILATIAPGAALPVGKSFAFAVVDYFTVPSGGGPAVITLSPTLSIPVLA